MIRYSRSPYYKKFQSDPTPNTLTSVSIQVRIWAGLQNSAPVTPTYTITKTPIGDVDFVVVELAQLVNDYIENTFTGGNRTSVAYYMRYNVDYIDNTGFIYATETNAGSEDWWSKGYGYFEEGVNPSTGDTEGLMIKNGCLQQLQGTQVHIPCYVETETQVDWYYKGTLISTTTLTRSSTGTNDVIQYASSPVNNGQVDTYSDYEERIENLEGNVINNQAVENAFCGASPFDIDEVRVTKAEGTNAMTLAIHTEAEYKYDSVRVTFVNKCGALQDLWLYKNSFNSIEIKNDQFKRFLLNVDAESLPTYNVDSHQYVTFDAQGQEMLDCRSGYVDECMNDAYKQLFLSEKVWISYSSDLNDVIPVTLQGKSFAFKTHLNQKLIEYQLKFKIAHDLINLVR